MTPLDAVRRAAGAAADKKAQRIVALEVGPVLGIADHFLICSGGSDRQVRTITEAIEQALKAEGLRPLRTEGSAEGGWILSDYGDFLVHVFSQEMREYYDLERLWKDAPRIDLPDAEQAQEAAGG